MDPRAKRALWVAGIAAVVLALVWHHNITRTEVIIFCVIVVSVILHEVSHGWVAKAFGDDTAARAGRLTLNPVPHVDPLGTLIVPALLSLSGGGFIGWAKPVPVDVTNLRKPRNQRTYVALAGPATNAVVALVTGVVFVQLVRPGLTAGAPLSLVGQVVFLASVLNVGLCAFNLVPWPPLDGAAVLERFMPRTWWPAYLRYQQYTMPALMILVMVNFLLTRNGHLGPISWVFSELYTWWAGVLGAR
jgi:Zn-dependent protease